jgi:hypothetical protein
MKSRPVIGALLGRCQMSPRASSWVPKRHEALSDVRQITHCVRGVEGSEPGRGGAVEDGLKHEVAGNGVGVGAVEVGGPSDGHANVSGPMGVQEAVLHLHAKRSFRPGRRRGRRFRHRAVGGAIHVEVVGDDQRGVGLAGGVKAVLGKRGQQGGPLIVRHIEAVVDDRGPGAGVPGGLRVGTVGPHGLRRVGDVVAAAAYGPYGLAPTQQFPDDGAAGAAGGTQNDVGGGRRRHGGLSR